MAVVSLPTHTALEELRALRQWVVWKYQPSAGREKPAKVPYHPKSHKPANTSDPATWASYDEAATAYTYYKYEGLGFVLTADDHYVAVDLDDCRDPGTGKLESWAEALVQELASYTEVSPSGRGLRILVKGRLPADGRRKNGIELYQGRRYVTITGLHVEGTRAQIETRQPELDAIYARVFEESGKKPEARPTPSLESMLPEDRAIVEKALAAENGEKFRRLSEGDTTGYQSQSEGDLAFCRMLAYWTRGDEETIDRIFRASGLMRDKWDEDRGGQTYGERTIEKAVGLVGAGEGERVPAELAGCPLPSKTAKEVGVSTPMEAPWIVRPWVAEQGVTQLVGLPKLAGKTTLLAAMVKAKLEGTPFLGEPTKAGPVVWLTEENEATFKETLARAGLLGQTDLHLAFRHATFGRPWSEIVSGAVALAEQHGAKLLIIDTIGPFSGIEKENDAAEVQRILEPVRWAASTGLGVIIVRHERKSGGTAGISGRGSSAFEAGADIILTLRRPRGRVRPTVRRLTAIGRYSGIPSETDIELTEAGYVRVESGKPKAARPKPSNAGADTLGRILATLEVGPLTEDELVDLKKVGPRSTVQRALKDAMEAGTVSRRGSGRRGDPFRYFLPTSAIWAPSGQNPGPMIPSDGAGLGHLTQVSAHEMRSSI